MWRGKEVSGSAATWAEYALASDRVVVPMPNDVIRQEIEKGGKRVQRAHGQARQEFDHQQILLQADGDAGAGSIDLVQLT